MRTLLMLSMLAAIGCADDPPPYRNKAMIVAKMTNQPNMWCEELGTGWFFSPDTVICQSAKLDGTARVPLQTFWCTAGATGIPDCVTRWDFTPKKKE